jgi:hypothetical protein
MSVHIIGIFFVILFLFVLSSVLFIWYRFRKAYKICKNEQSPNCPMIVCPFDDPTQSPCFGAAFRTDSNGNIQCST